MSALSVLPLAGAELPAAIMAMVEDLNARPTRKLGISRRQLFDELDQSALSSLRSEPYEAYMNLPWTGGKPVFTPCTSFYMIGRRWKLLLRELSAFRSSDVSKGGTIARRFFAALGSPV